MRYVLPTHWDDVDYPLGEPARDTGGLEPLRPAVAAVAPGPAFVRLDHVQTFTSGRWRVYRHRKSGKTEYPGGGEIIRTGIRAPRKYRGGPRRSGH